MNISQLTWDFYSIIAGSYPPWEAAAWTDYAERVELGAVARPSLSTLLPLPEETPWTLEDWIARGRPVDKDPR